MKNRLSTVVNNSEQAMSIKYNTMVYELQRQGKKVLIMSLGEAFFDIPLLPMEDLPFPQIYHYTHSMGLPQLREKLAEFFLKQYDIPINYEKEMLITAGSKAAIHFALMSILNQGDEVLIPEPAWVSYPEQVKLCYAVPVQIPYYKTVYDYEKYITPATKAIIICNPHNPSGYVYSEQEIRHLLALVEKYNIWLLSDEAYSEFVDEDDTFVSPAKIDRKKTHTIVFNSISKNYGISGWRLGYVVANEKVIFNILKINQHLITCPATILEYYIDKYFHKILEITDPQIRLLLKKRREVAKYMDEIGLKYLSGKSTFYFFVSISPSQLSSEEFATKLLFDEFISVVPGLGYGNSCDKFIRVSIGTATLDENKFALSKIKELIDKTTYAGLSKHNDVMVVAGGIWQKPLIQFIKDKGHKVTVVDPYLYSEGVQIADYHIQEDVRDVEAIYEKTKQNKYLFIASDQSDISTNTVSLLSEQFNLNSNPFQVTNIFVNKYEMRNLARKLNIPVPNYAKIHSVDELHSFINDAKLPVIIKPVDSQSSRGVQKIDSDNVSDVEKFFIEALKFSNSGFIIAEKFIDGVEYTVEGFASDYKHRSFAVSEKKHFRTGIASSLEYPANISKAVYDKMIQLNDKFVENSGLRFGITHAEYMIDSKTNEIYLIEIACRGGGTLISSDILNWITGSNVYDMFYDNLLGKTTDVKSLELNNRNAILQFFEFKPGKVSKIIGLEKAQNIEGVFKLMLSFKEGDEIKMANDDRSRQGFVIVFANSKAELDERLNSVYETLTVEYE